MGFGCWVRWRCTGVACSLQARISVFFFDDAVDFRVKTVFPEVAKLATHVMYSTAMEAWIVSHVPPLLR